MPKRKGRGAPFGNSNAEGTHKKINWSGLKVPKGGSKTKILGVTVYKGKLPKEFKLAQNAIKSKRKGLFNR